MLRGKNDFALNFTLLVSPSLIKPVAPTIMLCYVTECGGLLGHGQGCHYLSATSESMGKGDIQQYLSTLDTKSTIVSDTLASRAEPLLFGWTDITLEQTYEYWNS